MHYKDDGKNKNYEEWGNRYAFRTPPGWEFYDLKNDPFEMDNRYNDPAYKDIIENLKLQLKELRIETKEIDQQFPEIQKVIDEHWND